MNEVATLPLPPAAPAPPPPPIRRTPRWLAISISCLFAGLIPETIATSSTSVAALLVNPIVLVLEALFYGTAMLILRELIIRKPASRISVVIIGVAFGFWNEGVVAGTWYTVLETGYQFIGPVVLAWAVAETVFHIFISMLMTVAFTEVLFPRYSGQSLLGLRGIAIASVIFLAITGLVALAPTYRAYRLIVFAAALVLVLIAVALPAARPRTVESRPVPGLWRLRGAGFVAMSLYFLNIYLLPVLTAGILAANVTLAQGVDIVGSLLLSALLLNRGSSWMRRADWGPRQNLALISGALAFMMLLMAIVPQQLALLQPVASVPFFILLLLLARRWKRLEQQHPPPPDDSVLVGVPAAHEK